MYNAPPTAPRHTAKVTSGSWTPRLRKLDTSPQEAGHLAGAWLALERERERESLFFFIHRDKKKKNTLPSGGGLVVELSVFIRLGGRRGFRAPAVPLGAQRASGSRVGSLRLLGGSVVPLIL